MNTTTKPKKTAVALRVVAIIVGLAVLPFTLAEISLVYEPTKELFSGEIDFKTYTQAVQKEMTESATGKYTFINLNGLYCRLTGRNVCNQIMRLDNGMLTNLSPERFDMLPAAEGIAELAQFCEKQGTRLIFALPPAKLDAGSEILIPGEVDHSNENGDEFISLLAERGVDTLDLREYLAQTPEQIEQYFFRTDHHWNFTGAFVAYQKLTEMLADRFPEAGIDSSRADIANWEAHTLENWMLGSQGKRTGVYFGGTDDITYYTPLFETHSSCDVPEYSGGSAYYEGDFVEANIREEYLGERPDLFEASPYDMYIGGEYHLVRHRSDTAPSDLKLMIIKDSFTLPIQAFMSTQFKSIDVLDPRYEGDSVAEHILETRPDVVLVLVSAQTVGSYPQYSDYGIDAISD